MDVGRDLALRQDQVSGWNRMNESSRIRHRQTANLRKGRISLPGARYFVTCSVVRPSNALSKENCVKAILEAIRQLCADNDMALHCGTIMPDHVHLLFTLGTRLTVSRVVAKLKGLSDQQLKLAACRWQANFFEHRLRENEALAAFVRYVFMNPYRASLITREQEWPYWIAGEQTGDFARSLKNGRLPPEEWFAESLEISGLSEEVIGGD